MENPEQPLSTPPSKKNWLWLLLLGVGVLAVALGAAFVAGRYFRQTAAESGPQTLLGGPGFSFSGPEGAVAGEPLQLQMVPASELPTTMPDAIGVFLERKDNSLFLGLGENMVIESSTGEQVQSEPAEDAGFGDENDEVVISNDTVIYKDTTQLSPDKLEGKIQQTVELSTIDDIAPKSMVTVWGRKVGDRLIADTVLFSQPMEFIRNPAP